MCDCGVCAMLNECRHPKVVVSEWPKVTQIADKPMLTRLAQATLNAPLPALSPLHETYRGSAWGSRAFRDTLWPGRYR
jgi:hypothetical protein